MTQMQESQEMELLNTFIEETKTNIEEIEKGILTLEKNLGDMECINHLLVQFHTIKGNAKFFELSEMNELCHATETLLEDITNKKMSSSNTVAECLFESEDVLKKLLEILLEKLPSKEEGKPLNLDSENLIKPILKKLEEISKMDSSSQKQPETSKELPETGDGQPADGDEQPADGDEQPADGDEQPEPDSATSLTGKFLTFRLEDEYYAIPIQYVVDIISMIEITPLPQTTNFVKGLINLRGIIAPVIDLRLLFKMPYAEYTKETCIIVIDAGKGLIGAIVDVVAEVMDIEETEVEDAPDFGQNVGSDYIMGMSKVNDEVKILLDIEKLLNETNMVVD